MIYTIYREKNQDIEENDGSILHGFVVDVVMEKLNLQFVLNIIYLTANKMMKKTIIILLPNIQSTNVNGLAIYMLVIKIQQFKNQSNNGADTKY